MRTTMESYYTVNSAAGYTVIAANATGEFGLNGNKVLDKKCAAKNNVALLPAIIDDYQQDIIIIGSKSITIGALVARKLSSTRRQQQHARRIRPCLPHSSGVKFRRGGGCTGSC